MHSLLQLKTRVYSKLSADTALISLLGGQHIFDTDQPDAKLPYIAYGKQESETANQLDADLYEHLLELKVVSKADSALTCHNILSRLEVIFDEQFAANDLGGNFKLLLMQVQKVQISQVDFNYVKGLLQLRILVEQVAI